MKLKVFVGLTLWLIGLLIWVTITYGQVPFGSFKTNSGGIVCPASGSSIQVLASNGSRQSYAVVNDSGTAVRVGFLTSGTATLDDTNSLIIQAGGSYNSSPTNTYFGRVVCMSTTGSPVTIHFAEETRQ